MTAEHPQSNKTKGTAQIEKRSPRMLKWILIAILIFIIIPATFFGITYVQVYCYFDSESPVTRQELETAGVQHQPDLLTSLIIPFCPEPGTQQKPSWISEYLDKSKNKQTGQSPENAN